jgi:hypothetical protein
MAYPAARSPLSLPRAAAEHTAARRSLRLAPTAPTPWARRTLQFTIL